MTNEQAEKIIALLEKISEQLDSGVKVYGEVGTYRADDFV